MYKKTSIWAGVAITLAAVALIVFFGRFMIPGGPVETISLDDKNTISWNSELVTVSLEENGTTGYKWEILTGLEIASDENIIENEDGRVGVPHKRVIKLTPGNGGNIILKYKRHWEKEPIKEFDIRVINSNNKFEKLEVV